MTDRARHSVQQSKGYGSWALAIALGAIAAVVVHWRNDFATVGQSSLSAAPAAIQQAQPANTTAPTGGTSQALALRERDAVIAALRDEIKTLSDRVAQLEGQAANTVTAADASQSQPEANGTPSIPTVASLTALGEDAGIAEQVLGRLDELALQRLNLRHQARLDGADRASIGAALRALPNERQALREEFGDASYDRYLYASGRPNRLAVRNVLQDSAAQGAGLQPGDVIQSIDGSSVFTLGDLQRIVREPDSGTVSIEVSRGSERFVSSMPRGPLGVRTLGISFDPSGP